MGTCAGLSGLDGVIGAAASAAAAGTDVIASSVVNGNLPVIAALLIGVILLAGLYQVTRIGASFLALTGFFIFVLCPP
ncbi:MAG: hypothetical protein SVW02_02205 [Candidatus Nanohaloarchaea archaeon]|nr:hypothetical protein [Candidatus Nanohaloarchaea archaeon]